MTTSPPAPATATPVSVIGLGAMGATLGRALLRAGHPTTVWNRTATRAEPLIGAGATLAAGPAEAVRASPLTLLCLLDAAAVDETLQLVPPPALQGRTVVNLSSSVPREAREIAALVEQRGASYLDGAIMVPTSMIGDPDAMILLGGQPAVLDAHRAALSALAGRLEWVGEDPGLAAVHDLALLDLYLLGMAGFLHAAAMAEAEGVPVATLLPYASGMTDVLRETLPGLARDVAARSYPGDEDTTRMELAIANHIVETSEAAGVDPSVPELVHDLLEHAISTGHGDHGFSSLYERFRSRRPAPA